MRNSKSKLSIKCKLVCLFAVLFSLTSVTNFAFASTDIQNFVSEKLTSIITPFAHSPQLATNQHPAANLQPAINQQSATNPQPATNQQPATNATPLDLYFASVSAEVGNIDLDGYKYFPDGATIGGKTYEGRVLWLKDCTLKRVICYDGTTIVAQGNIDIANPDTSGNQPACFVANTYGTQSSPDKKGVLSMVGVAGNKITRSIGSDNNIFEATSLSLSSINLYIDTYFHDLFKNDPPGVADEKWGYFHTDNCDITLYHYCANLIGGLLNDVEIKNTSILAMQDEAASGQSGIYIILPSRSSDVAHIVVDNSQVEVYKLNSNTNTACLRLYRGTKYYGKAAITLKNNARMLLFNKQGRVLGIECATTFDVDESSVFHVKGASNLNFSDESYKAESKINITDNQSLYYIDNDALVVHARPSSDGTYTDHFDEVNAHEDFLIGTQLKCTKELEEPSGIISDTDFYGPNFVYDGQQHAASILGKGAKYLQFSNNPGVKTSSAPGQHTANVSLISSQIFGWKDGTSSTQSKPLTWTIGEDVNEWTQTPRVDSFKQTESLPTPQGAAKYGVPTFTYARCPEDTTDLSTLDYSLATLQAARDDCTTAIAKYAIRATVLAGDGYNGLVAYNTFYIGKYEQGWLSVSSMDSFEYSKTPSTPVAGIANTGSSAGGGLGGEAAISFAKHITGASAASLNYCYTTGDLSSLDAGDYYMKSLVVGNDDFANLVSYTKFSIYKTDLLGFNQTSNLGLYQYQIYSQTLEAARILGLDTAPKGAKIETVEKSGIWNFIKSYEIDADDTSKFRLVFDEHSWNKGLVNRSLITYSFTNYKNVSVELVTTCDKARVAVGCVAPASITYGDAFDASTLVPKYVGFDDPTSLGITGTSVFTCDYERGSADANKSKAGKHTISVNVDGLQSQTYDFVAATGDDMPDLVVLPKTLTSDMASLPADPSTYVYDGKQQRPSIVVGDSAQFCTLTANDYELSFGTNINAGQAAGTYTVTAKSDGNYTGTVSGTFDIAKRSMENATVADIENQTYTGAAIEPKVQVTDIVSDSTALKNSRTSSNDPINIIRSSDYEATYVNNVNANDASSPATAPTATINATQNGNYTGSISKTFVILKAQGKISAIAQYNKTCGDDEFEVAVQREAGTGDISVLSSDDNVATITKTGDLTFKIQVVHAGTCTLHATMAESTDYTAATFDIGLEVAKKDSELVIDELEYTKTFGDADFSLNVQSAAAADDVLYESSNNSVATVSAAGVVHIAGVGKASITVAVKDTSDFKPITKTVTLNVLALEVNTPVFAKQIAYDGAHHTSGLVAGADDRWQVLSDEGGTDAGTYQVVLCLKDKQNTFWTDTGNTDDVTLTYEIVTGAIGGDGGEVSLGSGVSGIDPKHGQVVPCEYVPPADSHFKAVVATDGPQAGDSIIWSPALVDFEGKRVFACDTSYTATITLMPDEGFYFSDDISIAEDGWTCKLVDGQGALAGSKLLVCTKTFAKTAQHSFDEGKVVQAPEVGKAGKKVYTCTCCGFEKEEAIDPLPAPDDGGGDGGDGSDDGGDGATGGAGENGNNAGAMGNGTGKNLTGGVLNSTTDYWALISGVASIVLFACALAMISKEKNWLEKLVLKTKK